MTFTRFSFLVLVVLSLLSAGCAKEGCTDTQATNYVGSAKTDDGSCLYAGDAVFWYNETTSKELVAQGIDELTLYINQQVRSTWNISSFWDGTPICDQDNAWTTSEEWANDPSLETTYSILDLQTGITHYSGTITFNANDCSVIQLQ